MGRCKASEAESHEDMGCVGDEGANGLTGKYALHIFPEAGHFLHEDQPENTAMVLVDFYRRNDRSALVLPPKVSELLAQGRKV